MNWGTNPVYRTFWFIVKVVSLNFYSPDIHFIGSFSTTLIFGPFDKAEDSAFHFAYNSTSITSISRLPHLFPAMLLFLL